MRGTRFTLAVAAALLLTGCASDASPPSTAPSTPTTDTASSEALQTGEALTTAVDAYLAYMDATVTVADQGHDDDGLLDAVTTGEAKDNNWRIIESAAEEDWSVTGTVRVTSSQLVDLRQAPEATTITADICSDQSDISTLHEDGTSVFDGVENRVVPIRVSVVVVSGEALLSDMQVNGADLEC